VWLADVQFATVGADVPVTDDHRQVAHSLAQALVRRGVRHLAGPVGTPAQHREWLFVDSSPVTPAALTPCSSFVVYPAASRVSSAWLSPKARQVQRREAPRAVDVLLLTRNATVGGRSVGRDLLALDALTALHVLGG